VSKTTELCGRISVFVLHSVFEEGTAEYLLLKALRCFVEVDIYAGLEVHTEKTIASGREKLTHFFECINVSPLPITSHMLVLVHAPDPGIHHC